jgi:threonine synthase
MKFFSTNRSVEEVSFEEAILKGLPDDNGLYFPSTIPILDDSFWNNISQFSFQEIAFRIAQPFVDGEIPDTELRSIINEAVNFDAPLEKLKENLYCLELFHGTSMAFKDFGARFMAGVMSYFLQKENKKIEILVATSGDTGGAVAYGFYKKKNIGVRILYPSKKVSNIQEKQLTTLGHNISAYEIEGTFDDCQALVKKAFLDKSITAIYNLASANSINIARLIPQAFYYVWAYRNLSQYRKKIVFSVPSGNLGNLCAGLLALKMGMPNTRFILATNLNKVLPTYLETAQYNAISPSIATISNAMDVGNPSNFPRLTEIFSNDYQEIKSTLKGYYFDDTQTREGIKDIYESFDYLACPHTAIAYLALKKEFIKEDEIGVFLSTAHYAKFLAEMKETLGFEPSIPDRLAVLLDQPKQAYFGSSDYEEFKSKLIEHLRQFHF